LGMERNWMARGVFGPGGFVIVEPEALLTV
jgi:hypothetical protein